MCLQHKELTSLAIQIAVRMLNIDAVDGDNEESCLLGYNEMLCGGSRFIPNVCKYLQGYMAPHFTRQNSSNCS
jgi:hypothetical protein